ncbi:hypothetical protein [Myxococcus xanthus]|uniref:Lipoprotein n=1 Tax=Myxococcus xanthus TaxID=34 RepID=A0A7Y4IK16_MYXXA|nr:hypothetical protein [Myxococcus xanthus]NOJ80255.1 hypothetical protein [Myxococcus xanthus]NOJ87104.1 hypothetical protein [Myxococcus xanthus]
MNRTVFTSHAPRGMFRNLLVLALLAWSGGCAVEDPVARLRVADGGTGTFSTDDDEALLLGEEGLELALPDCAEVEPDAGSRMACEDAGTQDVP